MEKRQAQISRRRRRARPGYRADVAEVLGRLLGKWRRVTPGKMFGFPGFYSGGKLFACVYGEGVGLKLPAEKLQKLEGQPGISPFRPYGMAGMREWVQITRDRAGEYRGDAALFRAAIAFVGGDQARRPSG
jgi:hypothetical protein